MKKCGFWKMPAMLAALGLASALVLSGCPQEVSPDIGWTAAPGATNNAIVLTFNDPVRNLTLAQINVSSEAEISLTGISGQSRMWTVEFQGNVDEAWVQIDRGGISRRPQLVEFGTGVDIDWTPTIQPFGNGRVLQIAFGQPVANAASFSVDVQPGTGAITGLTNWRQSGLDGTVWIADFVFARAGTLNVSVTGPGISNGPAAGVATQMIGLYAITVNSLGDETVINGTTQSFNIVFSAPVALTAGNITLDNTLIEGAANRRTATVTGVSGSGTQWNVQVSLSGAATVDPSSTLDLVTNPATGNFWVYLSGISGMQIEGTGRQLGSVSIQNFTLD